MYTHYNKNQDYTPANITDSLDFLPTRGYGRDVLEYILRFRNLPFIKLKNETIAKAVGCSERTIMRWTNRFSEERLITKFQLNGYAVNEYKVNISNNRSFALWLSKLTPEEQQRFMDHGINAIKKPKSPPRELDSKKTGKNPSNSSTVTHSYSSLVLVSSSYKPIPILRARAHGSGQTVEKITVDGDGYGNLTEKERNRRERSLQGIAMLKKEQKEWILKHRKDENIQELLNGPKIRPLLITPLIETITTLLDLDTREQLKLVALPEEALEYAHRFAKDIVEGVTTLKSPIVDRMGWFMSLSLSFCKTNNVVPDWHWYFQICEILGIQALKKNEPSKPLVLKIKKKEPKNKGYSPYDVWEAPKPDSREVRIVKLRKDIEGCKKILENPPLFAREESIRYAQNALNLHLSELLSLEADCQIH